MATLNPYLNFNNNCREAMAFYQACIGGELHFQSVKESPEMAAMMPPEMAESILHSVLTSGEIVIMASDCNSETPLNGNTVSLCVQCESEEELKIYFNNLAKGGKIDEPVKEMPWKALFGALTDKFGKKWMFNYSRG